MYTHLDNDTLSASINGSYQCQTNQTLGLNNGIILTFFNMQCRAFGSGNSSWFSDSGTCLIEISRLLTNLSRGNHMDSQNVALYSLVGCIGFNGPLRQYFSLYRALSQKREIKEERKNVQTTPALTYCKRSRPLPCKLSKSVGSTGTGSLPSTIAPAARPPPPPPPPPQNRP